MSHTVHVVTLTTSDFTQNGLAADAFKSRVHRLKESGIKVEIDGMSVTWSEPRTPLDDRPGETVTLTYSDIEDES